MLRSSSPANAGSPEPASSAALRASIPVAGLDTAAAALVAGGAWLAGLGVVEFAALVWLVLTLVARVRMRRGHSVIEEDGLLLEYGGRQRKISWDQSWTFTIRDGLRWRYLTVENATFRPWRVPGLVTSRWRPAPAFSRALELIERAARRHPGDLGVVTGRRLPVWAYPAAVAVLLAVAVVLERPWYWAGGAEAATLPPACSIVDSSTAQRFGLGPTGRPATPGSPAGETARPTGTAGQESTCTWTGPGGTLTLRVRRFDRSGIRSGTAVADLRYDDNPIPAGVIIRITHPKIGDEARMARTPPGRSPSDDAYLLIRRANVLVYVVWRAATPPPAAGTPEAVATEVGRSALTAASP